MSLKILIAEDEVLVAEHTKSLLLELGYTIVGVEYHPQAILETALETEPDLVLLDIQLIQGIEGIELAQVLKKKDIGFLFLSANSAEETLKKALDLDPLGYLAKPISGIQLQAALISAEKKLHEIRKQETWVQLGATRKKVNLRDLLFVKAENVYCSLHFKNKNKILLRSSFSKLLAEERFQNLQRVHRSYAVNPEWISEVTPQHLVLDGLEVPHSKSYFNE